MGYGVSAFAVPLDAVRSVLGSGDTAFLAEVCQKHAQRFEESRRWRSDVAVSLEAALGDLLTGSAVHPDYQFQYVYAFELLCVHFGTRLSDGGWSGCPRLSRWVEQVDTSLAEAGVPPSALSVAAHLMDRGVPPGLPSVTTHDYPAVGYLLRLELPAVDRAFAAADLLPLQESEVGEAVETLVGWVAECRESQRDLVCFSY